PGRLPSIRSRDLTLGGVKKKTFTPNIISRKIKEEPREEVSIKKEKKERERERQREGHSRGRGRPEVIQSHSIFEQGPAEMMKKKGSWDKTVDMADFGPSHIINIKKEKRETDEETKQILRMLQKDDFLDDPGLKNDIRNKPVQLPLAHSGWLFKEEVTEQEDTEPWLPPPKEEKMELDPPGVKDPPCTLGDLPEGQVGKLLVRKSGKVQLVLGKVTLDVTMGTPCSFLQELVSVGIGDNRMGEMMVLGHVKHKLVCSPDFEALLEHRHR
ncbi:RPC4 polymerase, partial [Oreotrochilus melanogaster]|nr:RPC4 polymerase [Oreotrochilus melanogaster]